MEKIAKIILRIINLKKANLKVAKLKDGIMEKYYLPSFKFGDLNGDWSFSFNLRTNIWIISLGLLLIL